MLNCLTSIVRYLYLVTSVDYMYDTKHVHLFITRRVVNMLAYLLFVLTKFKQVYEFNYVLIYFPTNVFFNLFHSVSTYHRA